MSRLFNRKIIIDKRKISKYKIKYINEYGSEGKDVNINAEWEVIINEIDKQERYCKGQFQFYYY